MLLQTKPAVPAARAAVDAIYQPALAPGPGLHQHLENEMMNRSGNHYLVQQASCRLEVAQKLAP
jgi:hypothetical protein